MNNLLEKRNIQLAHRWFDEVWNEGNLELVTELFAADGMSYDLGGTGNHAKGPEGIKPLIEAFRKTFPDLKIVIQDAIADEEKVAMRWAASATHTEEGMFGPPTFRKVYVTGMAFIRCNEGQIMEAWNNWDIMSLVQQIQAPSAEPISNLIEEH
jgi:steroid delta-isomerase-like uncharacterized protein